MNHYSSILAISFGFLVINFFINSDYLLYSVIILMGMCLISESFAKLISFLWEKLTILLSFIVPNILLSLIYFFILTPVAFLSKIFRAKTNFQLKNQSKSSFVSEEKVYNKESFENPW